MSFVFVLLFGFIIFAILDCAWQARRPRAAEPVLVVVQGAPSAFAAADAANAYPVAGAATVAVAASDVPVSLSALFGDARDDACSRTALNAATC